MSPSEQEGRSPRARLPVPLLQFLGVALAYFLLVRVGLLLASLPGGVSPMWPATGLAMAACLRFGTTGALGVLAGAAVANWLSFPRVEIVLVLSLANLAEGWLGAWMVSWVRRVAKSDSDWLLGASLFPAILLAPIVSAMFGVSGLLLAGAAPAGLWQQLFITWWVGDVVGAMTLLPSLLHFMGLLGQREASLRPFIPRLLGTLVPALLVAWLVFASPARAELVFATLPVLLLARCLLGRPGVLLVGLALSLCAIASTLEGAGLFLAGSLNESLLYLQIFLFAFNLIAVALPLFRLERSFVLPALLMLTGWLVSGWLFAGVMLRTAERRESLVLDLSDEAATQIQRRMARYEEALRGGVAFLSSRPQLTRSEWDAFADSLNIHTRFPGINGMGVVFPVREADFAEYERQRSADGWPGFAIKPVPSFSHAPGSDAYVITYISPAPANRAAVGLDLASEPHRRLAAERARDLGGPVITRHIQLVQDGIRRPGFLMYLPVYEPSPSEAGKRRLKAWVYAPFICENLMSGLFGARERRLALSLWETTAEGKRVLIHRSAGWREGRPARTHTVSIHGCDFTAEWIKGEEFPVIDEHGLSTTAAAFALMSVMLAGMVYNLERSGREARRLIAETTRDLAAAKTRAEAAARLQGAVLDGTPYSIIATDTNGLIEVFNSGAEQMLGYTASEVIGKRTPVLFHLESEVRARSEELSKRAGRRIEPGLETLFSYALLGLQDQLEWTYVRKDGSHLPVLLSITSLHDREGRITGHLGIASDLTERKRTEEDLRRSQNHLVSIFSAVEEGLVMQDTHGAILECNASAERILGLTREQMSGRDSLDPRWQAVRVDGTPFPGDEHPAMVTLRTGRPLREILMGLRKPEGNTTWITINSHPVLDSGGQIVAVVCSFADITQRRAQEHQLRSSMLEIINLKTALDEHAIVAITDRAGVIQYVNERFCRISKYGQHELIGQTHRLVNSGLHPPEFFRQMWQTISSGRVWHGEIANRTKDGGLYWVETTIVPFLGDDGKPSQYVAIRTDITERKLLDEELARARDEALASSRLKSEFLATMSHEIRTPMNGVIGMTELLLSQLQSEQQREMGRTIQSCARNLLVILNDILDFSKIEAGRFEINPWPFRPAQLLREVTALMTPRAAEKKLAISCEVDPRLEEQHLGDSDRIRQVLANILNNAIKFTDQGSVSISARTLDVEPNSKAGIVRFEVRDTGIGISSEAMPKLFQPFVQVDGSVTRRFGGTGLGLAISRRLVELMSGRIGVQSEEGRGSLFWVELPLALFNETIGEQLVPLAPQDTPPPIAQPAAARALHLLVAEDNPVNQVVVRMMLEKLGHRCEMAENGEEALTMLARGSYDAVLLDCQMPVLDGYQTARRIRAGTVAGVRSNMPIIALTAYAMAEDRARCLDAGMDDYVTKPLELAGLIEALERVSSRLG